MERPDVSGTIDFTADLDAKSFSGLSFSEEVDGTITFTSVNPDLAGTFKFSAKDEEGESATVEGKFKTARPELENKRSNAVAGVALG